ncbi:MAG TPA: glycoside hydrolase family 3 C-terminal domain-containing protein [Balneolales bacterium]|nr:glycoside hydrolase family 3 C-terminal domain-containing protein [Balneolales bacterium]
MTKSYNKGSDKYSENSEKGISRKDFLKKSMATAGFLAIGRNNLMRLGNRIASEEASLEIDQRVKSLIGKMTLKEKVSQLLTNSPAIQRLGVPKYDWWSECLHGVARAGLATSFPQAIGLAASWNTGLMHTVADAISDEARAKHHKFASLGLRNRYMGLTFFAPNINLVRDPRWGRGQETYGEDPFLTGQMAKWYIKGLQGNDPKYFKLIATSKHFAVYNGPEPERHKINVNVDKFDLHETYLAAFKTTIEEANVGSVMCAYNSLDGMPCCGNNEILTNILRNDWKFGGYVVSDCGAISDFYRKGAHDVVDTDYQSAAMGINSGTDLNCGNTYRHIDEAQLQGLVSEKEIDKSLYRLFTARFRLGMFDKPENVPYTNIPYSVVDSDKNKKLALDMARESMVLLKNEPAGEDKNNLLPLRKDVKSIAVIGPNADKADTLLGNYHGTPSSIVTPLKGIKEKVSSKTEVHYAQGSEMADGLKQLLPVPAEYLIPSRGRGHGLYAEYYDNKTFNGKPAKTRVDHNIDFTWLDNTPVNGKLASDFSVRWTGKIKPSKSGKYQIGISESRERNRNARLYLDGELKLDGHKYQSRFSVDLVEGHTYDIKIEYAGSGPDPQAHLTWYIPGRNLIQEAVDVAKKSDVVILCMGLDSHLEGEEMPVHINGFNGGDRTRLDLPSPQVDLMKKVTALSKPTVLVLLTGSSVAIPWAKVNIPSILEAWYGGQAAGTAIADILFGDYNPGGRLPVTFYKSVDDLPSFTNYNIRNRTYRYFEGEPLYPFGYGLSYTNFAYSNLKIPDTTDAKSNMIIKVDVTNTGMLEGDEVTQLYLNHMDYAGIHPIRTLKGFRRTTLQPGETQTVRFQLRHEDLTVVNSQGEFEKSKGRVKISVGGKQPGFNGDLDARTTKVIEQITKII